MSASRARRTGFPEPASSAYWTIPVPLRRSGFAPLHAAHSRYNVEVDLAAIRTYDFEPPGTVLIGFSDLQTTLSSNPRRLGSGRSVVHRGLYIKGVGRTPLAANWSDPTDAYHGSGHLAASSAIREYLVSVYLDALGLSGGVVPCKGVLLRRHGAGRRATRYRPRSARGLLTNIDRHLQALTLKSADFLRLSNISYALDRHGDNPQALPRILEALASAVSEPATSRSLDPDGIAHALVASVHKGLNHFSEFLHAGLFWGSLHNNYALDGRFIDLETPVVVGQAHLGHLARRPTKLKRTSLEYSLEILRFRQDAERGLHHLASRVRRLTKMHSDTLGAFVAELANGINVTMRQLPSHGQLVDELHRYFASLAPRSARPRLRRLFRALATDSRHRVPVRRLPLRLADVEPCTPCDWFSTFDDFEGDEPSTRAATAFNDSILDIEAAVTVDAALARLRAGEREIRRAVSSTLARGGARARAQGKSIKS